MGTPWWIDNSSDGKYYHPNDNFTIRLREILDQDQQPTGSYKLLNEKRVGRSIEELMLWVDMMRSGYELEAVEQWYLYDILEFPEGADPEDYKNGVDWVIEPNPVDIFNQPEDPDCQRLAIDPTEGMNTLVGYHALVKNQYYDIYNQMDRTSPINSPSDVGILQRMTGTNSLFLTDLDQLQLGFSMGSAITFGENEEYIYDDHWNTIRPKLCIMKLFDDRVKIYNVLAPMYPMAHSIDNNEVSEENLVGEFFLRDENYDLLDGATAICNTQFGLQMGFLVAFGDHFRRYNAQGRPTQFGNGAWEYIGNGDGDIIAIEQRGNQIAYIQGDEIRGTNMSLAYDGLIEIKYKKYDTDPQEFDDAITGFTDLYNNFALKDDELHGFSISSVDGTGGATDEVYKLDNDAEKIINIKYGSSIAAFLVPLKRYFNLAGQPTFNADHKAFNILHKSGDNAQILGRHIFDVFEHREILYHHHLDLGDPSTVQVGVGAFRTTWYEIEDDADDYEVEYRCVYRVNMEALRLEPELQNKELKLVIGRARLNQVGFIWGGADKEFTVHYYEGAWPPTEDLTADFYGGVGAQIGTCNLFAKQLQESNQFVYSEIGTIDVNKIRSDNYLYFIIKKTTKDVHPDPIEFSTDAADIMTASFVRICLGGESF